MRFERTPGQEPVPPGRRRLGLTLALFAFACALVVQSPAWAQTSYMALSKALSQGTVSCGLVMSASFPPCRRGW